MDAVSAALQLPQLTVVADSGNGYRRGLLNRLVFVLRSIDRHLKNDTGTRSAKVHADEIDTRTREREGALTRRSPVKPVETEIDCTHLCHVMIGVLPLKRAMRRELINPEVHPSQFTRGITNRWWLVLSLIENGHQSITM